MTDLETLRRIAAQIRAARDDLADLKPFDYYEFAHLVPEVPEHVREKLEE